MVSAVFQHFPPNCHFLKLFSTYCSDLNFGLNQTCPKSGPRAKSGQCSYFHWPEACHKINNMWPVSTKYTRNFIFHHRMAVNLWPNSRGAVLRVICLCPFLKWQLEVRKGKLIARAAVSRKNGSLNIFFTEFRNNSVCLIYQETVAVFKEFNIKRHYQTKHANYDKRTGNERSEKLKQLEAGLTAQQHFFTRASESNENARQAMRWQC